MDYVLLLLSLAIYGNTFVAGQYETFPLNQQRRLDSKPTIAPELRHYFELDGHAAELVDSLIGPRPGGFFPEKTYDVGISHSGPTGPIHQPSGIEKTLENFFSAPAGSNPNGLPPGFNQGFSLLNGNTPALSSFQENSKPKNVEVTENSGSSIAGIPKTFPSIPKPPMPMEAPEIRRHQPIVMEKAPELPKIASRPEVPEGGFGPAAFDTRNIPSSVSEAAYSSSAGNPEEYGSTSLSDEPQSGGLIGTLLDLIGFNKDRKPADNAEITKAVGNILGGQNSPLPGKDMISNVLYKALTQGSIQNNDTDPESSTPLTLNAAQKAAIDENLSMLEGLITKPGSPLCNPKPVPVSTFNVESFMGQWYQVVYSQIVSKSPCSMVSYKKLNDVQNGGIGTIFEIFEYSTDGTPYSEPKITSGYGILKQIGELIFRTSNTKEDVDVHVLYTGPMNSNGEYEFVILSTNCNFPVYVLARDPLVYKQRYEVSVNKILEQKGIINGFSRLLNFVQNVDVSTCSFPPTLFKFKG
jgi:hypothetical protein